MDQADDRIDELELRRREARRAVDEAGGGESEGFEQHTPTRIMLDAASERETAGPAEGEADAGVYGEADEECKQD
jgi:hypothetical protein